MAFETFLTLRYWPAFEYWWLGVATTVGTALLAIGADRSRYGEYVLYLVGGVLIVAVLVDVTALVERYRIFNLGVWIGLALNRFAFGFLRPMPEYRQSKLAERVESG